MEDINFYFSYSIFSLDWQKQNAISVSIPMFISINFYGLLTDVKKFKEMQPTLLCLN